MTAIATTGKPLPASAVPTTGLPARTASPTLTTAAKSPTGYDATAATASGGGFVDDAKKFLGGLGQMAGDVQDMIEGLHGELKKLTTSKDGNIIDTKKLWEINQRLSQYTMMLEQLANLQRREERAQMALVSS